jgi:hypothetical protein
VNDDFLVAKYDGITSSMEVPINLMPIWVRVLDLPFAMMNKKWGETIGNRYVGHVREVGKDKRGHDWLHLCAYVWIIMWRCLSSVGSPLLAVREVRPDALK